MSVVLIVLLWASGYLTSAMFLLAMADGPLADPDVPRWRVLVLFALVFVTWPVISWVLLLMVLGHARTVYRRRPAPGSHLRSTPRRRGMVYDEEGRASMGDVLLNGGKRPPGSADLPPPRSQPRPPGLPDG